MSDAAATSSSPWLDDLGWIRRLAYALVHDEHAAEDLMQETLISAHQERPDANVPWRQTFAVRMRNRARSWYRSNSSRTQREREHDAQLAMAATAEETEERYAQCARVALIATELPEPYRSVIRLRYLEDLMPREIALRTGAKVDTVKKQLVRGLEMLRERLDVQNGGDRNAWMVALLPIAGERSASWLGRGSLASMSAMWIACAIVLLAGTTAVWLATGERGDHVASASRASSASASEFTPAASREGRSTDLAGLDTSGMERQSSRSIAVDSSTSETTVGTVRGYVVDTDGKRISGQTIINAATKAPLSRDGVNAQSGENGEFIIDRPEGEGIVIAATSPSWMPLFGFPIASGDEAKPVVAPRRRLGVSVLGDVDKPLHGASVSFTPDDSLRALVPDNLVSPPMCSFPHVRTDGDGRIGPIDIAGVPGVFSVQHDGYWPKEIPTDGSSDLIQVIRLKRPSGDDVLICGKAKLESGKPAATAKIDFPDGFEDRETAVVDSEGRFELAIRRDALEGWIARWLRDGGTGHPELRIRASLDGSSSASEMVHVEQLASTCTAHALTLRLKQTLSISGRIVRADGQDPSDALAFVITSPNRISSLFVSSDGQFECEGLTEATCTVDVVFPSDGSRMSWPSIRAGSQDLLLTVPVEARLAEYSGYVVDWRGNPMCGARITTTIHYGSARLSFGKFGAITDNTGAFSFVAPHALDSISVGDDFSQSSITFKSPTIRRTGLRFVVQQAASFRVVLSDQDSRVDSFVLLDDAGNETRITSRASGMEKDASGFDHDIPRPGLRKGRSATLITGDSATTLVLMLGDTEVRRHPIRLTTDRINVIPDH